MKKIISFVLLVLLIFSLVACGTQDESSQSTYSHPESSQSLTHNDENKEILPPASIEQSQETIKTDISKDITSSDELIDGMRPEFIAAMDAYEAFYVEYVDFMAKYKANPTDLSLLTEYGDMLIEMQEMNVAFEAWESESLNNEELKYYLDVSNRIMKMLVDVAG